jgi:hypothetical protein
MRRLPIFGRGIHCVCCLLIVPHVAKEFTNGKATCDFAIFLVLGYFKNYTTSAAIETFNGLLQLACR